MYIPLGCAAGHGLCSITVINRCIFIQAIVQITWISRILYLSHVQIAINLAQPKRVKYCSKGRIEWLSFCRKKLSKCLYISCINLYDECDISYIYNQPNTVLEKNRFSFFFASCSCFLYQTNEVNIASCVDVTSTFFFRVKYNYQLERKWYCTL